MSNFIRTGILLAIMTAFALCVGYVVGGLTGVIFALLFSLGMNFFSWWNSDKMILRLYGAREIPADEGGFYYDLTSSLARRAGIPCPRLYILETAQPNAFATGRNPDHGVVAVSRGLLEHLSQEELSGVIAHELAHIRNRDTLIMTISASFAGMISMLSSFMFFMGGRRDNPIGMIGTLLAMILAPIIATIIQMTISRRREYVADYDGGMICGNPIWLADALKKIAFSAGRNRNRVAEDVPATAHLFIINPLSGEKMDSLFSTHPNTENRIAALARQAQEMEADNRDIFDSVGSLLERRHSAKRRGPWG